LSESAGEPEKFGVRGGIIPGAPDSRLHDDAAGPVVPVSVKLTGPLDLRTARVHLASDQLAKVCPGRIMTDGIRKKLPVAGDICEDAL